MSIKPRVGQTQSLQHLLNKEASTLGAMVQRAAKLKHLETKLLALLPADWRDGVRVADVREQRLILIAHQAALLTFFRFQEPIIRRQLQLDYPQLERIELKIRPAPPVLSPAICQPLYLSARTKKRLATLAQEELNPDLKKALECLSKKSDSTEQ